MSRQEPSLGEDGRVRFDGRRPPRYRDRAVPDRPWRWWLLAGLALLVALVFLFRGVLADRVMPPTRAQALIAQAGDALAAGRLTAADGTGARELYEAAVAIDPDRLEARTGLADVARAALGQARVALAQDRFEEAHRALRLARELSVPRDQADAVATALREREAAHAGIDDLMARAEAARVAGHLDGDAAAALPLYARVLALQPRHADALRGREDAIGALLDAAREGLRSGDVAAAANAIAIARRYDAGHVDLPDTQARLTEELDALRRRAEADLSRGRVDRAVAAWQMLLRHDPDDAVARAGLERAAEAHAARARRFAADFRFADADASLREATALAPANEEVLAAVAQVQRSRLARRGSTVAMDGAERRQRVGVLLEQAAAAEQRGELLAPPGDSAFDKLRAAQALAPDDVRVRRAVARLLPSARTCFENGLRANDLGRARDCLEVREALGEELAALGQARRRLAQRWLAIGDERLAAGELQTARAALESARSLDPTAPGIEAFTERLRTANATARP
jgi:tetratricopeptide (TPR) repeat protein